MSAKPKVTGRGTRDWQELDARHYMHPFTDFRALAAEGSRVIVRGEGVHLHDSEGQEILDAMSGLWCVNIGYGRHELADAAAGRCGSCRTTTASSRARTRPRSSSRSSSTS